MDNNQKKVRIIAISVLLIIAVLLTYYFHGVMKTDLVFTHFFYIPIAFASLWWKKKGIWVAVFLSFLLIAGHVVCGCGEIAHDYFRIPALIIVAFIIALLQEHITKAEQELREHREHLKQQVQERTIELVKINEQLRRENSERRKTESALKKSEEKLKEALERLEAAYVKLQELDKNKTDFVSHISHELRTPFTAIKESIDIVAREMKDKTDTKWGKFLEIAKRNIDRLFRMINSVLDFQKLEAGRMEFDLESNNINDSVKEAYNIMFSLAQQKGLEFVIEPGDGLPLISYDKDRIIQVLMNLINNAVKFTEEGSITISTYLRNNNIEVAVKDTGCGIEPESMPLLFHSFEQLAKDRKKKIGGTGLGLSISKKIVEKHSGKIWAESEYGKGSVFYFTLPISGIKEES